MPMKPLRQNYILRTVIAFLVAPQAAVVLMIALYAGDGLKWETIPNLWLIASYMSYLLSLPFGAVIFLVLRYFKRESLFSYALGGFIAGAVFVIITWLQDWTASLLFLAGMYGLLATAVAVCFHLIRGRPPINSDQPQNAHKAQNLAEG